jgi:Skp family chaperone for outer membrane proteins
MAEFEIGGMTFKGGKMMIMLTALSTLGGGAWGGFQFYDDYMDMKEIVANIDTGEIESRNKIIEQKLDDAISYTRDIKSGLRDDILSIEKQADRVEDQVRASEEKVRDMIDTANQRFETKRDALKSDTDRDMKELESRLTDKLQRALDNPLADQT